MDIPPGITIYNFPPSPPRWDRVGVFYITYCTIWTVLLSVGMIFCWINRHNPLLRPRGLPLSFSAVILLHLYWILGQITYPIGMAVPTVLAYDIQYFFMGIWFPLGIALFHASNSRFYHVAQLQKQFSVNNLRAKAESDGSRSGCLSRLRNMRYMKRVLLITGIGMVIQVLLTVGMWLVCRKYHPTFGIPGTEIRGETFPEQLIDLGRGWEWWPSVLWQFIWTWIVAPILIWRSWGIRDTLGWRFQTVACCISSLHATPMFLISTYVSAFEPVNRYFHPSQWIHLSILVLEIFTVFIPTFELLKQQLLAKRVLALNRNEDSASETGMLRKAWPMNDRFPMAFGLTERQVSPETASSSEADDLLLTMSAFIFTLNNNPGPLQDFSALHDFSGENIAFLTALNTWKASWQTRTDDKPEEKRILESFNGALDIYINFISPRDAEFPLNLSSVDLKNAEAVFERTARQLLGEATVHPALLFEAAPFSASDTAHGYPIPDRAYYAGTIPEGFGPHVFDNIEQHIKYLVLTNTWPKFVKETMSRRNSAETERSGWTLDSQNTLVEKVSIKMSKIIRHFD